MYKNKYLKYKNKYLELKDKQTGGSIFEQTPCSKDFCLNGAKHDWVIIGKLSNGNNQMKCKNCTCYYYINQKDILP